MKQASGAQTVERAFRVLRLIARRGVTGMSLTEVAAGIALPHPTAHRLLRALVYERALIQDPGSRRYKLGATPFELSLASGFSGRSLAERYRPLLQRLAGATDDTVYLVQRSGFDAICVDRIEARTPVRIVTTDIGEWRPLGVGSAGIALLAALPEVEADACVRVNAAAYDYYRGLTEAEVRRRLAVTRREGFGFTTNNLPLGTSSVGVALPASSGVPFFGVSIGAMEDRIVGRLDMLKKLLREEVGRLTTDAESEAAKIKE